MKELKQNILNFAIINKLVIKKVLNTLLYNKILVRTFDMHLSKKKTCVLKRSTMLKIIGDNYSTFFLLSPKAFPQEYQHFRELSQFNFDINSIKEKKHLYIFKSWKNYLKYTGYSYKVCDVILPNFGIEASPSKYRGLAYGIAQSKFIQVLKKKFKYFVALHQYSTVLLLLSPIYAGYKSYSRGIIGAVRFKQIKFFLLALKNNILSLKKIKSFLILRCKLAHIGGNYNDNNNDTVGNAEEEKELQVIIYFQSNLFFGRKPFFFFHSMLDIICHHKKGFINDEDAFFYEIKKIEKRLAYIQLKALALQEEKLKKAILSEETFESTTIIKEDIIKPIDVEESVNVKEVIDKTVAPSSLGFRRTLRTRLKLRAKLPKSFAAQLFELQENTIPLEMLLLKEYYK